MKWQFVAWINHKSMKDSIIRQKELKHIVNILPFIYIREFGSIVAAMFIWTVVQFMINANMFATWSTATTECVIAEQTNTNTDKNIFKFYLQMYFIFLELVICCVMVIEVYLGCMLVYCTYCSLSWYGYGIVVMMTILKWW